MTRESGYVEFPKELIESRIASYKDKIASRSITFNENYISGKLDGFYELLEILKDFIEESIEVNNKLLHDQMRDVGLLREYKEVSSEEYEASLMIPLPAFNKVIVKPIDKEMKSLKEFLFSNPHNFDNVLFWNENGKLSAYKHVMKLIDELLS